MPERGWGGLPFTLAQGGIGTVNIYGYNMGLPVTMLPGGVDIVNGEDTSGRHRRQVGSPSRIDPL